MIDAEKLQELATTVATAVGESKPDFVTFAYRCVDGDWGWECRVEGRRKPHGRGHKVMRHFFATYGATPEAAAAEALRKSAIPGWLEI